VSSYRRRAAYDVLPVRAATMIRGIAWASAAVTASATIALKGPSGGGTGAALALEEHVLMRNFRISRKMRPNTQIAAHSVLFLDGRAIPHGFPSRGRRCCTESAGPYYRRHRLGRLTISAIQQGDTCSDLGLLGLAMLGDVG